MHDTPEGNLIADAVPAASVAALACRGLTVAVPGRVLVAGLELAVGQGRLVGVLGENGSGKTLTLHTLAGLRAPSSGRVRLFGGLLDAAPRRHRARRLGLLAQHDADPFPSTVLESALIGRHPHVDFWRWESAEDVRLARAALERVDLAGLEQRAVATLSGGERRRLALATVLTQDPDIYLLDEPLNHLDPHHQLDVLRLFRAETRNGKLVFASLHDVNLAAQFTDDVLLLFGNGEWRFGASAAVLSQGNVSRLYRMPVEQIEAGGRRIFLAASA
ncbi:MAG TPA: ABC transporter ATP-binding protein [Gammaproteobacteria bacterium]|nr:ABC transporter ATP-binding protein [Gammaproteobacteria bacterium]